MINNKQNQNQSGAIEPIVSLQLSVAINEYQCKTKTRYTLHTLVKQNQKSKPKPTPCMIIKKNGGDGPAKYMLQPCSALAQG
jgi:hypothetical protein